MGLRIAFDVVWPDAFRGILDDWEDPDFLAAKRDADLGPDSLVANRPAPATHHAAEVQACELRGRIAEAAPESDEDTAYHA